MVPILVLALLAIPAADSIAGKRPNVIVILTDDQGYGDLSCHGNPVLKTPNLDRLHREGARFVDFHVSPTCAPTRSALLTGRHEFRNGVTHTILERERLAPGAITLADVLKRSGYSTGIFGKWHLGDEETYRPDKRGFAKTFIHGAGGIGQSYPGSCGDAPGNNYFDPAILHDGKFEKTKGYCTDVFFAKALSWIEAQRGGTPFFCWISPNAPHEPLQVLPEDEARYANKGLTASQAKFFGMVANIDDNVGRLLAKLQSLGVEKSTLVVFMNDNGGTAGVPVWNSGMRGAKVTPWLGGTRASSFWRWPGTIAPGDRRQLAAHVDFFPTVAAIAGAAPDARVAAQVEGRSLLPPLENPAAPWEDRTLFTHVGRWPKGEKVDDWKYIPCSVRTARWHLVNAPDPPANSGAKKGSPAPAAKKPGDGKAARLTPPRANWRLFDVDADPGERTDVRSQHLEIAARMESDFDRWWESIKPMLVNETAAGPFENPFKTLYREQFP
ncbi:MAG TPA: arylsulfatase [Planctomycetia bacterium]|nr:arylsulfatase [Planctomycetia bacterium]